MTAHCVNCIRWEGKHWHERARCSLLLIKTARLSTCGKFQAWPSLVAKDKHEATPVSVVAGGAE